MALTRDEAILLARHITAACKGLEPLALAEDLPHQNSCSPWSVLAWDARRHRMLRIYTEEGSNDAERQGQ